MDCLTKHYIRPNHTAGTLVLNLYGRRLDMEARKVYEAECPGFDARGLLKCRLCLLELDRLPEFKQVADRLTISETKPRDSTPVRLETRTKREIDIAEGRVRT